MFKQKILRNPVVVSTIVALVLAAIFAAVYLFILEDADKLYLWVGLGVITGFYFTFQLSLWLKKKNSSKVQRLETEEEALSM
ncbi:hypothetical protein RUL30_004543, partial [Vibrio parahaemolyticus]|nr:hypothetical protein [Vibrio parahaemolyticus]NMU82543.1 hypothetical protein [Vibrio parahaemolyticus]